MPLTTIASATFRAALSSLAILALLAACGSGGSAEPEGAAEADDENPSPPGSEPFDEPDPSDDESPDGPTPDEPANEPEATDPDENPEPSMAGEPDPGNVEPETDPYSVAFECDPAEIPSATPLLRLSIEQYRNTLTDLFAAQGLERLVQDAEGALSQLPADGTDQSQFKNVDGRLSQRHVDGYFGVTAELSLASIADDETVSALYGDCALAANVDEACLSSFVESFGKRAFRRPLGDEEVARLLELNDGSEAREVYRSVLFTLLMAPDFLYHVEVLGNALASADHLEVSAYELASRLSYHFWQTLPDDELMAAADDGSLLTEQGYSAQVERLFADPRAERSALRFFSEWYRLEIFGGFAQTPAFDAFSSGVDASADLYAAAAREIEELIRYELNRGANYRDLLSSDAIISDSPELAALYGVEPYAGSGDPERFDGERAGVLTRAALLISSNHETNPFKRGAFVRNEILCAPIEPPPGLPSDALAPPPFDPMASTRQRFEAKVEPAECSGCHAIFTPYGMALENYDGLGRYREQERLIDDEGTELGAVPIDATVEALFDGNEFVTVSGPVELSARVAESESAQECFARQYFRYTYRRFEQPGDECALRATFDRIAPGGTLRDALRDVALDPAFKQRVVGTTEAQ